MDLLSYYEEATKYYLFFKSYGFDINRDLKKYKISSSEYETILNDLANPISISNNKGVLKTNRDKDISIRKIYVSFRNDSKINVLRVVCLIYDLSNHNNTVYIFPFHLYSKKT